MFDVPRQVKVYLNLNFGENFMSLDVDSINTCHHIRFKTKTIVLWKKVIYKQKSQNVRKLIVKV